MNPVSDNLDKLFKNKKSSIAFLKENISFYEPFLDKNKGILKTFKDKDGGDKFHSTSTSFAFYYISNILESAAEHIPNSSVTCLQGLYGLYGKTLIKNFNKDHKAAKKKPTVTATAKLPNSYNTPLQILGVLSAWKYINPEYSEDRRVHKREFKQIEVEKKTFSQLAKKLINENFVEELKKNNGFISRIGAEDVPSPYLTFWVLECISAYEFASLDEDNNFGGKNSKSRKKPSRKKSIIDDISNSVLIWATNYLSRAISYTYSGLPQSFDAIEVCYLLLILLSLVNNEKYLENKGSSVNNIRKLIRHALSIVFTDHFKNGCFTKSLPVFANTQNFSLSCSTVEPVSLMLMKHRAYLTEHTEGLSAIYHWIDENKYKNDGKSNEVYNMWRTEWEHSSSPPTPFMAFSVYTFVAAFLVYLDHLLSDKASKELGVKKPSIERKISQYRYPGDLGEIIKYNIVKPIEDKTREIASLSVILFGPPGTSKTTISKKIAQDLNWPLLVINTNDFLKNGIEKLDSEADRIFRLVSYLEDVVVLFDEVEELVLNRDAKLTVSDQRSRLLTTSMLPRINDLRNTGRIVFIFATNYLDHMDSAIIRTGRFDCVQCILPPNSDERKRILKSILIEFRELDYKGIKFDDIINDAAKKHLFSSATIRKTALFCYADLEALIKRAITRKIRNQEIEFSEIVEKEINVGLGAVISEEKFLEFKKYKSIFDRPNFQK